jgi:hypothetical protein
MSRKHENKVKKLYNQAFRLHRLARRYKEDAKMIAVGPSYRALINAQYDAIEEARKIECVLRLMCGFYFVVSDAIYTNPDKYDDHTAFCHWRHHWTRGYDSDASRRFWSLRYRHYQSNNAVSLFGDGEIPF